MDFYPAIDLKDGQCVRLVRGRAEDISCYNSDPVAQARLFEQSGARWLHIVDLDAAFSGVSHHQEIIKAIVKAVSIPLQLGGGIRNLDKAEEWLSCGVARVVFGTLAIEKPDMVKQACRLFPNQIAVGIDAQGGIAMSHGWVKSGGMRAVDLAKKITCDGLAVLIYTDIDRDGTLSSPNFEEIEHFAASTSVPVIASGGVSNQADLEKLSQMAKKNITGVICGKALYSGNVSLADALAVFDRKISDA